MEREELWLEVGVLRRLVYKNVSQHRASLHMQKMREVRARAGTQGPSGDLMDNYSFDI